MLNLETLLFRDDTPERLEYCQPQAPEMTVGDIWHCTISHRTYMCVEGVQDPMFNNVVEIEMPASECGTRFDCKVSSIKDYMAQSQDQPSCNGLCLTGSDIGVPSSLIAYAHPECEAHGK